WHAAISAPYKPRCCSAPVERRYKVNGASLRWHYPGQVLRVVTTVFQSAPHFISGANTWSLSASHTPSGMAKHSRPPIYLQASPDLYRGIAYIEARCEHRRLTSPGIIRNTPQTSQGVGRLFRTEKLLKIFGTVPINT